MPDTQIRQNDSLAVADSSSVQPDTLSQVAAAPNSVFFISTDNASQTISRHEPQDTIAVVVANYEQPQDPSPWVRTIGHPLVVGIVVGIVLLILGRVVEHWLQRYRRRQLFREWLHVVADEIKRNLRLLAQTDAYLYVGLIPTYSLSLFAPEHAFREMSLASRGHPILNRLFSIYYEYQHIQDRLTQLDELNKQRIAAQGQPRSSSVSGSGASPLPALMQATRQLVRNNICPSFELHQELARTIGIDLLPADHLKKLHADFQAAPEVKNARGKPTQPLPQY